MKHLILLLVLVGGGTSTGNASNDSTFICQKHKSIVYARDYDDVVVIFKDSTPIDTLSWIMGTTITVKPKKYCK